MKKKRTLLIAACICIFTVLLLASCAVKDTKDASVNTSDEVRVTEGADTPVTITSYTDFSSTEGYHFLSEGEKVAVISPSALPTQKQYEAVVEGLKEWGYEPVPGKYVCVEERTLDDCLEDLEWALTDPEIRAIYCVRGGHASSEVLDAMQLQLIENADKPIIGYSDITAYHSAWTKAGEPSIHAPMAVTFTTASEECAEAEKKMLEGEIPAYKCRGSEYDVRGSAEGVLIGGNLATLTTVLDTAYDCTTVDEPFILFLEEVDEDYEHVHRYLTILDHLGVLDKASGVVFGEWVDYPEECDTYNGNSRGGKFKSMADMISRQFLTDKNMPAAFGFPAGHADVNYPLLMGAKVKLDVGEDSYTIEWLK